MILFARADIPNHTLKQLEARLRDLKVKAGVSH